MKSIIFFLGMAFSISGNTYELKAEPDYKITDLLARLVVVHEPIIFPDQGYIVKFYGHDFGGHCAEARFCRSLVELLVVTTEIGDEGPVSNLYRLPRKHEWEVLEWNHLKSGKQSFRLKSTQFESNLPDSKSSEQEFNLTTTWVKAELEAL